MPPPDLPQPPARLSDGQREAILAPDGPLLITAGPGTGKTLTVAERIAHLVTTGRAALTEILALTFSRAAARTLSARLAARLGPAGAAIHATTFHAFGLWLARRWPRELGYAGPELDVYGEREARALLLAALGEGIVAPPDDALAALAVAVADARMALALGDAPLAGVVDLAERYERLLREHRAVDFDAMLAAPLRLFREHPGILDRCRDTYRWIVADECQDLSAPQCATLRLLAGERGNLTVVGDACQNVYAWRGADASFLLGFSAAYPAARVVALTENFRSTGGILAVANALGAALPYGHRLWTANPPGPPPTLHAARDPADEATFVAGELARLLDSGALALPREVAVLARTNGQLDPIRAALRAQGLPIAGEAHSGAGVRLGTIHAAKGDEWRAVFLVGVEEGLLPHRRAIEEEQGREPAPTVALAGELHAAYVGATRPREYLYLTYCRRRDEPEPDGGATTRVCRPSRFLDLLPPGSLARAA